MSRSTVVLCPGRGAYTASELGYLSRPAPTAAVEDLDGAIDRSDGLRTARGDLTIRSMDGARKFDPAFFAGENAAGLTFACTAFDFLRLDPAKVEVVAVGGNSMGWYSALFTGGALTLEDTFDLVETMGGMTRDRQIGAQVIYPLTENDWRADEEARGRVDGAIESVRAAGHQAGWSIHYGGFAVVWADDEGVAPLLDALPETTSGSRKYPLQLPGHAAFHSPLMQASSDRGVEQLASLPWRAPRVPMVDGRGFQWRPLTTDPAALCEYTLRTQVLETFDFSSTVRVALREYAPDQIVLLGPGEALGAAVAQVVIAERWQGIDSREAFAERQEDDPFIVSIGRPDQAERVLRDPD